MNLELILIAGLAITIPALLLYCFFRSYKYIKEYKIREKQWNKAKTHMLWKHKGGKEYMWFSICSLHFKHRLHSCDLCAVGKWVEKNAHIHGGILYKNNYKEWFRRNNTPEKKRELAEIFPGLRSG